MLKNSRSAQELILVSFLLIAIDQTVKYFITKYFLHSINRGFPFIESNSQPVYIFLLLGIILVIFAYYALRYLKYYIGLPIIIIFSGIISNIIDRIFRGGVVDYLDIKIWPVFNLADIYIILGILWAFFDYYRIKKRA